MVSNVGLSKINVFAGFLAELFLLYGRAKLGLHRRAKHEIIKCYTFIEM